MCGRYGDAFDEHHFLERWAFARPHDARVGPQLAPTDPVTVIDGSGTRVARWGLLPHSARSLKEAKRGSKINAPVEALSRHPMYVHAAQDRVLVPATHWFEWCAVGGAKVPHVLRRRDHDYMAFAGVRDTWIDPESGVKIVCAAIVTRPAYAWMADVHSRMPLVLSIETEQRWLDASLQVKVLRGEVLAIDVLPELTAYPVAPITSPKSDDPEMLAPVGAPLA
ncbi:MAG TPA: SOS response-associated peptidase family protein [Solirubrobacteraceae bacterium]|nr:SOS response-associated peptidase family protein [Solirubrobacteraceae bacterium]